MDENVCIGLREHRQMQKLVEKQSKFDCALHLPSKHSQYHVNVYLATTLPQVHSGLARWISN